MAKHVSIDWVSVVGYRITENILGYINQLSHLGTELSSKRIELDTSIDSNKAGLFLKPGILTSTLWEGVASGNSLGVSVELLPGVGEANLHIYPGKAVTYRGQIIELDAELTVHYLNATDLQNKTIILRYKTQDSDEIPSAQTYHPVTGATAIPVKMKTFDIELVDYSPETDLYLNSLPSPFDGDYVPIGKVEADYSITYNGGHRRIALVSVPWLGFKDDLGWGHWVGEFNSISNFANRNQWNLYNFLACKGSKARTERNPLGLTPEDIGFTWSHLYVSHGSGFSTWPTTSLQPSLASFTQIDVAPIASGEWVYLIDRENYLVLTSADIPATITYNASGLTDGHYYLLRLYSDNPAIPTFALEAVDLGNTEAAAIASLKSLYTQRHKEDAPADVGWIGLAVFRYTGIVGIVTTGPSFSEDFWLKDSTGTHLWNMYRVFQATTTSTTDIVHDGKARTPYPIVVNPNSWWSPGSKLLRDLVDYIFETSISEESFNSHKNKRCDGSEASVQADPATNSQHWADVIRIYGNTPPYFEDLYLTDWIQQCGRSIDRLFSKLSNLRKIKRTDKEYNTEALPYGTVRGGLPFGAVNRYGYWASQIALENKLGGDDIENQYNLNTLLNNERMLEHESLMAVATSDSSGLSPRNGNIVAISQVPNTTKSLVVRVGAVVNGGNLVSLSVYCWILERAEDMNWNKPPNFTDSVDIAVVNGFLRFEPSMKIAWYQSGNALYFYFNVDSLGYTSPDTRFGNVLLGYKYDSDGSFDRVANYSSVSDLNEDRRGEVRVGDLLVDQAHSRLFHSFAHVGAGGLGVYPKVYDIDPNNGSLTFKAQGGTVTDSETFGSSLFYDEVTGGVYLVVAWRGSASPYYRVSFFIWDNPSNSFTSITPGDTPTIRYTVYPDSSLPNYLSPLVYANRFGFYIGFAYHVPVDTTYGIAYMQRYSEGETTKTGAFFRFWRDLSTDELLKPALKTIKGDTDALSLAYNRVIDGVNMLPSGRSSLPVPMSRVDLVGGVFSNGSGFVNPIALPTTDRDRENINSQSIHWPSWCVQNLKGNYPYLSAEDYYFVAVGWHPVDEELRYVVFKIDTWKGYN